MTADTTLDNTLSDAGVMRLEPMFPKAQAPKEDALMVTPDGERCAEPDLTRWYRAYLSPTTGLAAVGEGATRAEESAVFTAVETLSADPGVAWAEPDYLRKPVGEPRLDSLTESAASAASGRLGCGRRRLPSPTRSTRSSGTWAPRTSPRPGSG